MGYVRFDVPDDSAIDGLLTEVERRARVHAE
jgi:hypothetical protein